MWLADWHTVDCVQLFSRHSHHHLFSWLAKWQGCMCCDWSTTYAPSCISDCLVGNAELWLAVTHSFLKVCIAAWSYSCALTGLISLHWQALKKLNSVVKYLHVSASYAAWCQILKDEPKIMKFAWQRHSIMVPTVVPHQHAHTYLHRIIQDGIRKFQD